jgi:hypothetical protein
MTNGTTEPYGTNFPVNSFTRAREALNPDLGSVSFRGSVGDPAYAQPYSDRERIPLGNRLVPAWPDRVLSWEELNDWAA